MNILVDINHPAHVHYFRNFSKRIIELGHKTFFVARNKEMAQKLLTLYGIPYQDRGEGRDGIMGKFIYLIYADYKILRLAKAHKIDLFLNFLHPYPSQVAKVLGKPSLVFSDSEHASLHHKLTVPFATEIFTPSCYNIDLGSKHKRFRGFMELSYLHPKYFKPNPDIHSILGLEEGEKFIILRFVSWTAIHDVGHSGLNMETKTKAIELFGKYAKVFISAEGELPKEFEKYRLNIPIDRIHDVLYYSDMIFGESATMASEASILGTPSFFISSLKLGYLQELENEYGLSFNFGSSLKEQEAALQKGLEVLSDSNSKNYFREKRRELLKNCVDTTDYMVNVVQNFAN